MRYYKLIFIFLLFVSLRAEAATNDSLRAESLKRTIQEYIRQGRAYYNSEFNEMLQLYENRYSTSSKEYAQCVMWCASMCVEAGDNQQAKQLLAKSESLFKKHADGIFDGKDTIDEIFFLDTKSKLEYNNERDYMALQYYKRSHKLKKQYFGTNSEVYLTSLLELSRLYAERLKYKKSSKYHNMGYEAYVELIKKEFCSRSESERSIYWNKAAKYINKTIDLAHESGGKVPSIASAAYNALLLSKGLLLNTAVSFENYINESRNERAIENLKLKKRLTLLGATQNVLDSLDYVILDALHEKGQSYTIPQLAITWEDVRNNLSDDDLAIEFYRTTTGEYGAILLKHEWSAPKLVRLDSYLSLEEAKFSFSDLLPKFLTKKQQSSTQLNKSLEEYLKGNPFLGANSLNEIWKLGKAIWPDEIVRHFPTKEAGRIYFSAEGALLVNGIEYLPFIKPTAQSDDYSSYHTLADLFDIYRLSSTREIIIKDNLVKGQNAVVYGGLSYDMSTNDMIADMKKYPDVSKRDIVFVGDDNTRAERAAVVQIPYLKGTKIEADSITAIINGAKSTNITAEVFQANKGTETSFKNLSGKQKKIIHIATHGFYHNQKSSTDSNEDNPLLRSGLFFAGADNKYNGVPMPEGVEDGILTAHEISTLDLQGADLIVLSACETGRGDITSDGVFGLQRGFKMACAGGILMSLWKVDDAATQVLMTEFYKQWMMGKSKHQALKIAKETVRRHKEWSSPEYWAAFILLDGLE